MCARMALCADGSGSGTHFNMLSLGLVCGLPLPMWNMFIVLCVRQTPRPPWPPLPSTSPRNLSCYSNSAWAIFLSQHLCKRYPSWRSARAKKRCQGRGVVEKNEQTKKKKNRKKASEDKTRASCERKSNSCFVILFKPFFNTKLYVQMCTVGLCVCNYPGVVCFLERSMSTSTFSSHGVLIYSGPSLDSAPSLRGHLVNYIFMPQPALSDLLVTERQWEKIEGTTAVRQMKDLQTNLCSIIKAEKKPKQLWWDALCHCTVALMGC